MYYVLTKERFSTKGDYANLWYERTRIFDTQENAESFVEYLKTTESVEQGLTTILGYGKAKLTPKGVWVAA